MKQSVWVAVLAGWGLLVANPSWAVDAALTTRVSGVVDEILVRPGQQVKKGAVLVRLDRTVLQARLEEASADLARAEAEEADAARELERAEELYNRTVSSTSELDAANLRHARAKATLAAAQARRAIAHKNLGDAELKAPFDGTVKSVPGTPGTVVTADCQPRTLVVLAPGRR